MPQSDCQSTLLVDEEYYARELWKALKKRLSVNPEKAVRIIILHEHDVIAAVKDLKAKGIQQKCCTDYGSNHTHNHYETLQSARP
jgi:hypothetical protein